jgi:opacity protein-like surface antigen
MQLTCLALCSASAVLCARQASAADWQVVPSMSVGTSYAENPRLLAGGDSSSSGTVGEIKASLRRLTERSELTLRPRFAGARYSDDESLDNDDQFINGGYRWVGERSEWNMDLGFTRDTTLTSELGSTGLVESNRRHEAGTFSASPKVMFTERVSGGLQMYLVDNRYLDAELTGLVDYRYTALSLFSMVTLTDAGSALSITAQGGRLTTEGLFGQETRDGTLRLGWSFQPWLLWTASLSAGPSTVETDAASDTGIVFDGEIKRQGDRWSLTANAGRSQSPTGRGVLTRRDEVRLTFARSLTERLSANIVARWSQAEDLLPQQGRTVRYQVDYASFGLGANWRLSRDWSVALQLFGNTQDYELATERANGYRASLSIVWNGQPQSL